MLLASSFIFRVNGYIRLQKTNMKGFCLNTFENNLVNSAVSHLLLNLQLLTQDTNIELLANKVGRMTF